MSILSYFIFLGLVIEEIVEDEAQSMPLENHSSSAANCMNQPLEASNLSQNIHIDKNSLESFRENQENIR